jgi:putative Holliday junction resolvase
VRPGSRIGIDVGTARIGVARSDFHGILATPVETVSRGPGDVERIAEIVAEVGAVELIVGLPLALSGKPTASTGDARDFAVRLTELGIPVRMVDERLSTVAAQAALHDTGKTARTSRAMIDQVAAAIILQHALDIERSTDKPPGVVVDTEQGH